MLNEDSWRTEHNTESLMKRANARYSNKASVYNSPPQIFFLSCVLHARSLQHTPSRFDLCSSLSPDLISLVSDHHGASLQHLMHANAFIKPVAPRNQLFVAQFFFMTDTKLHFNFFFFFNIELLYITKQTQKVLF